MITLSFCRRSVCMGDDAGAGEYTVTMPEGATLGELLYILLHGGNGCDWPIPYTGAHSRWVIRSDAGDLGAIYTDAEGEWHIDSCVDARTPLHALGITWVFGDRE
jgi:hypothetical protein